MSLRCGAPIHEKKYKIQEHEMYIRTDMFYNKYLITSTNQDKNIKARSSCLLYPILVIWTNKRTFPE